MVHDRFAAVLDWETQKREFERDGSLRDLYVHGTTTEDWKAFLSLLFAGNYHARLERGGAVVPVSTELATLFDRDDSHLLSFSIGDALLDCHFFVADEIELSFGPDGVSQNTLEGLLAFMVDIGEATQKDVTMTPENGPQAPFFRYSAEDRQLRWIPPQHRH